MTNQKLSIVILLLILCLSAGSTMAADFQCGRMPFDFYLSEDEPASAYKNQGMKRCELNCKRGASESRAWICKRKPQSHGSCGSLRSIVLDRSGEETVAKFYQQGVNVQTLPCGETD